jgi:hypothetical protein
MKIKREGECSSLAHISSEVGLDNSPETPSDLSIWSTARSDDSYLCVAACYGEASASASASASVSVSVSVSANVCVSYAFLGASSVEKPALGGVDGHVPAWT